MPAAQGPDTAIFSRGTKTFPSPTLGRSSGRLKLGIHKRLLLCTMELTQADYDLNDVVGGIVLPSPVARLLHIPANQSAESADMAWPLYMGNNVVCRGDPQ